MSEKFRGGWEALVGLKSTVQSVLFQGNLAKPVVATFDSDGQSSDGGVILLKSLDEGIQLTEKVSAHFEDQLDDGRARHQYLDLFRQRVYGIALGYADCNDAARTRSDPCLKMACDRSPLDSDDDLGLFFARLRPGNARCYRGAI
ncbi:MAG: transposase, partial [Planctomycetota bacterium]